MFSEQLKKLRKQSNMTQAELANALFVSQQAVARWETDKATPNPETLAKLVELFDVSADEVLGTTERKKKLTPEEVSALPGWAELEEIMESLSPAGQEALIEQAKSLVALEKQLKGKK